jgi:hypothetical protein
MALIEVAHDPFASETSGSLSPVEHDPFKESSIFEAMKKGFGQALTSENLQDIASAGGPAVESRMARTAKTLTGLAKLPANVLNLAGISEPLNVVNQTNNLADKLNEKATGIEGVLPGALNFGGELASGTGALNLIGKAAAPIEAAAPYIKPTFDAIRNSPLAQSVLGGAAIGAAGSESRSPLDIAKEAIIGAGAGGIGHGIVSTVGAIADPVLDRLKKLRSLGISEEDLNKLSTGQFLGGGMQTIENFLQDLPFGGAKKFVNQGKTVLNEAAEKNVLSKDAELYAAKQNIANQKAAGVNAAENKQTEAEKALDLQKRQHGQTLDMATSEANTGLNLANKQAYEQQKAILNQEHAEVDAALAAHHEDKTAALKESESSFHRPFVDRALSYLPKEYQLPQDLKGHELINAGKQSISKAYEDSLKDISSLKLPESLKGELQSIVTKNATAVGGEGSNNHKILENKVEELINSAKNGNWLKPKDWQQKLSDLSKEAWASQNPTKLNTDINYGKALNELKDKWVSLIEDHAGSDLFKNANKAYSEFKIPEKAASYLSSLKNAGEANPNDLLRAVSSELSTSKLASGQGEVQQMAEKAYKDMMANRTAHAASIGEDLAKIKAAKEAEHAALDSKFNQANQNLNKQQTTNENLAKEQKQIEADRVAAEKEKIAAETKAKTDRIAKEAEIQAHAKQLAIAADKTNFQKAINEAKDMTHPDEYAAKRIGYNVALGSGVVGGPALTALGLSSTAGWLPGALYAISHSLYNPAIQAGIKKFANVERPEAVRQLGKVLKQNSPLAGLAAVESYQQHRQNPLYQGDNVTVESPDEQQ